MDLNARAKETFKRYIKGKNLRDTKQRDEILDAFLNIDRHVTAEELYGILKKKDPKIGYATVYRALKLMCECDIANEMKIDTSKRLFEHKFGHEHHDHLICTKCGRIIEVRNEGLEKIQEDLARDNNFLVQRHRLEMFGLCKKCR